MTVWDLLLLPIYCVWALLLLPAWSKPIVRTCTDTAPIDLLGLAMSEKSSFPRGVEIVADGGKRGYKFGPESITTGVDASKILQRCKYFPSEFSFVFSFQSSTQRVDNEYILTLLGPDRETVFLAIRLKKNWLYFDFINKLYSKRQTSGMKSDEFTDGQWHDVVITVANSDIKVTLDCETQTSKTFKRAFPGKLDVQNSRFYIASKRKKRNRYTGILREMKLLSGSDASYYLCKNRRRNVYPIWIDGYEEGGSSMKNMVDFEDSSSTPSTCNTQTKGHFVYRRKTGQLEMCEGSRWKRLAIAEERLDYITDHSNLRTQSKTMDFELFHLPKEGYFLASANQGRDRDMNSTIYKWTNGKFIPYQNITTDSAQDWEYFKIGNDHFLACANQGANERSRHATSAVYRWHPAKKVFVPHQYFQTSSAQSWESFVIDGKHYLAVANYGGSRVSGIAGSGLREASWVFVWDPDQRAFVRYQSISTIGGVDFEHFEADGRHYLAVANSFDGVDSCIDSVIYRWEYSKFVPLQYVETVGAHDWEHFRIGNQHFLAVANYYDYRRKVYTINSTILRLSESGNRFDKIQDIETTGALDWEFFTVGRDSFLIAGSSSDSNAKIDNTIYRWQGMEHFVPVHSIFVNPSADWEMFQSEEGKQFLVSANVKGKNSKVLELITY